MRGFCEPFDQAEPPVPLGGELGHGPGGLVEAPGFYLVENFPALLAPADQPGPFEHDQVLGDGLARERHPFGQPAGADLAVADQEVEDLAARRFGDACKCFIYMGLNLSDTLGRPPSGLRKTLQGTFTSCYDSLG